jgi:hypothetical protein
MPLGPCLRSNKGKTTAGKSYIPFRSKEEKDV